MKKSLAVFVLALMALATVAVAEVEEAHVIWFRQDSTVAVGLTWRSTSETQNLGYRVWRSPDSSEWVRVAWIEGLWSDQNGKIYFWSDTTSLKGKFFYRISWVDNHGVEEWWPSVVAISLGPTTDVETQPDQAAQLDGYALQQNYPNPFNPATIIGYKLPAAEAVELTVYNTLGQKIRVLANGEAQPPGEYSVRWDGRDDSGQIVAGGMYIYTIRTGQFTETRRMIFLK